MLKGDFGFYLADEKSIFQSYSLQQMPRYYSQAVTAVELPDDIFGCLPEFAIMMKHCFFILLIAVRCDMFL